MSRSAGKGRRGYLWAFVAIAIATGLRYLLLSYTKDSHVFLYYLLAVAFSVWAGGSMAGIVATILGAAAAAITLAPGFAGNAGGDLAGLALFVLCSIAVISLLQAQQSSAEQRMQAELAEQASRTRRAELEKKDRVALDNTWDVAIIVTDHSRIIREWNVGAAQMTGWSRGETIGQSADLLFLPEDLEKDEPRRLALSAEAMSKAKIAQWLKCRDGSQFYGEGMIRPVLDQSGWVSGFIMAFIDGTSRVQAQDELEARMLDRAKELESLTYSMAHDMRQYTRGIAVNATLIVRELRDKLSDEEVRAVERLSDNALQMKAMVDGILDHLRLSKSEPNSKPVDLSKLGEEAAERIQPAQAGSTVQFIVQPGMWVKGDGDLISLVILNLFENALKYGGGHVRFGYDAKREAYYVKDEGSGFNPEYAQRIFKPFVRLHGQDVPGTGIGLPNALCIVERHGGRMWAESDGEGTGATFFFTLKGVEEAPVGVLR